MDANKILTNKSSVSSPFFIKPDISPEECVNESTLLKEYWSLIQAGYDRKEIKLNNNHIYIGGQIYGVIVDSKFRRSHNYKPLPPQSLAHRKTNSTDSTQPMDQQIPQTPKCNWQQMIGSHTDEDVYTTNSSSFDLPNLTLISSNFQSIMSKKEALWEAVDYYKPDFIIGCETWLKPTITDNEVLPTGYKIHRKDCIDGYGGYLLA